MQKEEIKYLTSLAKKHGLEVVKKEVTVRGEVPYELLLDNVLYNFDHPFRVYSKAYRECPYQGDAERKLRYMKELHRMLWPAHEKTWNDWQEIRFLSHCQGYPAIGLAGGGGIGKSLDIAKIALIFYLSDPKKNACLIASVTLESLESRIWGYVAKLLDESELELGVKIVGRPPRVKLLGQTDKIHGMFAVAIRAGDDEKTISTVIGRHPDKGFMAILDESTDMNPAIANAIPNWERSVDFFQLWAIGNSSSHHDLHGAICTPKTGWDKVSPDMPVWENTHKGVTLYFNPYKSPAITEKDPAKKELLGKIFLTEEKLLESEKTYGTESDAFMRFVMGYWPEVSLDKTIASEQFLEEHQIEKTIEWAGFSALQVIAGLDPAFQIGANGCVLRLAIFGQRVDGVMALDFQREQLLFHIDTSPAEDGSAELKICQRIIAKLREFSCPISNMAIDVSGAGRALAELIKVVSLEQEAPLKIVAVPQAHSMSMKKSDPTIMSITPTELWVTFRRFVQEGQIGGLDSVTIQQIINRQISIVNGKLQLETKANYKSRMNAINPALAHSPDEADAAMLCLQAAILRLGFHPGQSRSLPKDIQQQWWYQKQYAFSREEALAKKERNERRSPLLANFGGSLEDIPPPSFARR